MKTPLLFQMTEYDCGRVSLMNCISFLFERKEIPLEILESIKEHTLDMWHKGTSRKAMKKFSQWLADFSKEKNLDVECIYLDRESVTFDTVKDWVCDGGVANLRCWHITNKHYVMISKIDNEHVYIFDPYFLESDHYGKCKHTEIIKDKPFLANRKVTIELFKSDKKHKDFALGPIDKREILLIKRTYGV